MPKVRTLKTKKPPEGWELIEPTLEELSQKMREAERDPHEAKRQCESLWPIFRLHHQKSRCVDFVKGKNPLKWSVSGVPHCRYVYEQYYKKKVISKELYDWCCREGHADQNLIAKWRKPGFERLCCMK